MKPSLYSPEIYDQVKQRINRISDDTLPQWGKMNAAQMMAHCAEVFDVYNGKKDIKITWFARLFKGMIKKVVFGDKPYKKNTATLPEFKVIENKDFTKERDRLLNNIQTFHEMPLREAQKIEHALFGFTTPDERGWAMYKHLDHHLNQFGV